MDRNEKVAVFATEVARIEDENLRNFAVNMIENGDIPAYFWEIGASSSGKFHPIFSQGEGGLVRHVKAAMLILEDLLRMSSYAYMSAEYKDYCRIALLFHDCAKYGTDEEINKDEYANHARNGAQLLDRNWVAYFGQSAPFLILNAMRSHMGQWSTEKEDKPFTNIDRVVHLADYISSRSYINIEDISNDYTHALENVLPF